MLLALCNLRCIRTTLHLIPFTCRSSLLFKLHLYLYHFMLHLSRERDVQAAAPLSLKRTRKSSTNKSPRRTLPSEPLGISIKVRLRQTLIELLNAPHGAKECSRSRFLFDANPRMNTFSLGMCLLNSWKSSRTTLSNMLWSLEKDGRALQ
jgi:hypothetical protein